MTKRVRERQVDHETDAGTAEAIVRVAGVSGVHGRPTTAFVKLATRFASDVTVCRVGAREDVDGKSALAILGLGLEPGSLLRIRARGSDAEEAVGALISLVRRRFREE
jgi:phosphocarrier protein